MISMNLEPNCERIGLLMADGYTRKEASKIEELERRENFLLDVQGAEGLGEHLSAELTHIQDKLRRLMKERALVAESGGACHLDPEGSARAPYAPTQTVASYAEAMRVNAARDDAVWDHEPYQPAFAYVGDSDQEWLRDKKLWRAGKPQSSSDGTLQPVRPDGRDQGIYGGCTFFVSTSDLRPWTNGDEREWRKRHA